jgi:hypothetical protein
LYLFITYFVPNCVAVILQQRATIIMNFLGYFKQVLNFFGDCLLQVKNAIDTMVQMDSSFYENKKRYDLFFIRRQIWNFLNSSSCCCSFDFLRMFKASYKIVLGLFSAWKNHDWCNGSNRFKFWWELKEICYVLRSPMNLEFSEF